MSDEGTVVNALRPPSSQEDLQEAVNTCHRILRSTEYVGGPSMRSAYLAVMDVLSRHVVHQAANGRPD